ncbi:ABC transporter permease [Actinomadura madurae]|nr:ABC transporter permease [Actinomadura madurae]MCP9949745.1 ABC transporter permease [Actinomadura madurae]
MTAVMAPGAPARERLGTMLSGAARTGLAAWTIVALIVAGLTVTDPGGFWTAANIANVLTATVVLGLVALGQHMVVLTGGIDLSVGSTATLSALLTAMLIDGYPIRTIPTIIGMLVLGAAIGAVHGLIVANTRIPAFVVTLSTFYLIQGVAFMISTTPSGQVTRALADVGMRRFGPFPLALAVLAVAALIVAVLLHRTRFGRHVHAVGGDAAAARSAGGARPPHARPRVRPRRDPRRGGRRHARRPRHHRLAQRGAGPGAVRHHRRRGRRRVAARRPRQPRRDARRRGPARPRGELVHAAAVPRHRVRPDPGRRHPRRRGPVRPEVHP